MTSACGRHRGLETGSLDRVVRGRSGSFGVVRGRGAGRCLRFAMPARSSRPVGSPPPAARRRPSTAACRPPPAQAARVGPEGPARRGGHWQRPPAGPDHTKTTPQTRPCTVPKTRPRTRPRNRSRTRPRNRPRTWPRITGASNRPCVWRPRSVAKARPRRKGHTRNDRGRGLSKVNPVPAQCQSSAISTERFAQRDE